MDIYLLNEDLDRFKIIRKYDSLTWNTSYNSIGSFELNIPLEFFNDIKVGENLPDVFIENTDDKKHVGVIQSVVEEQQNEYKFYKVTGSLSESVLGRRVQCYAMPFTNKIIREVYRDLLNDNIINPVDINRKIPQIVYDISKQPNEGSVDYEMLRGVDLASAAEALSASTNIGFMLSLENDKKLHFYWYKGIDRTLNQNVNDRIVIEQRRGTISEAFYYSDNYDYRTAAVIDLEEDELYFYPENSADGKSGLKRRETYFDFRQSISRIITLEDDTKYMIGEDEYRSMVQTESKLKLDECRVVEYLDSEIPDNIAKLFKDKFYLGDIISIKDNQTGYTADQRIISATEVYDSNSGYTLTLQTGESKSSISTYSNNGVAVSAGGSSGYDGVFLIAHPPGSYYETENDDESTPAKMTSKYGGIWTQLIDRGTVGAGGKFVVGEENPLSQSNWRVVYHNHGSSGHNHAVYASGANGTSASYFRWTGGTGNVNAGVFWTLGYTNSVADGNIAAGSSSDTVVNQNYFPIRAVYKYRRIA